MGVQLDIHVPGMDTRAFLAHWGLRTSLRKGGYVLSKRLSRLMHPYQFWGFFQPEEVPIVHSSVLNPQVWDGCGRVSRRWLREQLVPRLAELPPELRERHTRNLLHAGRCEITVMHAGGQEKGDVLVVDEEFLPPGAAFLFPAGSAKSELAQDGPVFVGIAAIRHHKDGMRLDGQSLINLYPFLEPDQLLAWVAAESELFLEALDTGRAGRVYSRLGRDEGDLARLSQWHVAEFLASGGDLRWFAEIAHSVGQQHLNRLEAGTQKLRLPAPGGRYYIFPAAVGARTVPRGHVELDPAHATAWVNSADWAEHIVGLLGGCDGDDAVWALPFTDRTDGTRQILVWRSPNQLGEYVLLRPTSRSHEIRWARAGDTPLTWPALDSRQLPPRVDTVGYTYLPLAEVGGTTNSTAPYTVQAMDASLRLAMANQGTLGQFCNATMVLKALEGVLPRHLPASLETIIDGSVKRFVNLKPVKAWIRQEARRIVQGGQAVPACLVRRLRGLLPEAERDGIVVSTDHWLDHLMGGLAAHQDDYTAAVEAQARRTMPPLALFEAVVGEWQEAGRQLRTLYGGVLYQGGTPFEARRACEAFLAAHVPPDQVGQVLLAAAAHCYTLGQQDAGAALTDRVVWQLGPRPSEGPREPGLAQAFIAALRAIGLLGQPVWTPAGAVLQWREATPLEHPVVAVTINGVWLNWLRLQQPDTPAQMSQVAPGVRARAKAAVARRLAGPLQGLILTPQVHGARLVLHGPAGNLVGYVARGQEARVQQAAAWRLAWAIATDGNLHAALTPAG